MWLRESALSTPSFGVRSFFGRFSCGDAEVGAILHCTSSHTQGMFDSFFIMPKDRQIQVPSAPRSASTKTS